MFFKKSRKQKENRIFEFTDNFCRNINSKDYDTTTLSDSLCPGLRMHISEVGNHSYHYQSTEGWKVIGNVFQTTVKEARDIVFNIKENREEFIAEIKTIKMPLVAYFKKYGKYPHQPKGTEVIISNENASLKQKIKDFQEEIERLRGENQWLMDKLHQVKHIVMFDETTED